MDTIVESLYVYFKQCPLMENRKINVDFLPEEGVEYSIDTTPAAQIVKEYTNGSSIRQYLFVIRSVMDYDSNQLQNIANSGFFEKLATWMEEQTKKGNLPLLPSSMMAQKIMARSTGYLFTIGPDVGKYQIQCALQYFQGVK